MIVAGLMHVSFGWPFEICIFILTFTFSLLTWILNQHTSGDKTLSINLVVVGLMSFTILISSRAPNLNGLLFGDILLISQKEVFMMIFIYIFALILSIIHFHKIILAAIHDDMARVLGINAALIYIIIVFFVSSTVALSIKAIGGVMVVSLSILPAFAGRIIARTPLNMAIFSSAFGIITSSIGLLAAFSFDTPVSPMITCIQCASVVIIGLIARFAHR